MRWTMVSKKLDEIGTLKLVVQQEFTNDVYDVNKNRGHCVICMG